MTKFTTAVLLLQNGLLIKNLEKSSGFITQSLFDWELFYKDRTKGIIEVPKGFETDFGSIPFPFKWLLNPVDKIAYILHDYIFSKKVIEIKKGVYKRFGLIEANNILFQALRAEGLNLFKSCLVWLGLFIGSWWCRYEIKNLFIKK